MCSDSIYLIQKKSHPIEAVLKNVINNIKFKGFSAFLFTVSSLSLGNQKCNEKLKLSKWWKIWDLKQNQSFPIHLSRSVPALQTNGGWLNEKGPSLEIDSDSRGCPVEPEFTLLSSCASLFQFLLRVQNTCLVSSQVYNYPILPAFVTVLKRKRGL